jgi:hypothetical protein
VIGVPTIAVERELFWGDDRLEDAAAHLGSLRAAQLQTPVRAPRSRRAV